MIKDYGFKPTPVDESKNIEDYTKKEAKLMFEWYLDDLPKRTEYLFDYINETDDIPMEFTFETFKKVVDWLAKTLRIIYKTPEEKAEQRRNTPEYAWDYLDDWRFSEDSELIITAVGGYLGMVMVNEIPGAKWVLDTYKRSVSYNNAVIKKDTGGQLEPVMITDVISSKLVDQDEVGIDSMIESWKR